MLYCTVTIAKGTHMSYDLRAVDRIYEINKSELHKMADKLKFRNKCNETSGDIYSLMKYLFYFNFEDYYESNKQYLGFIYTSLNNRIKSVNSKRYNYENKHITREQLNYLTGSTSEQDMLDYNAVWNNVVDPNPKWYTEPESCTRYKDLIATLPKIKQKLADSEVFILDKLHEGCTTKEIVRDFNIKFTSPILNRKKMEKIVKEKIRPVFEDYGLSM
jgi:hypothetical protein